MSSNSPAICRWHSSTCPLQEALSLSNVSRICVIECNSRIQDGCSPMISRRTCTWYLRTLTVRVSRLTNTTGPYL